MFFPRDKRYFHNHLPKSFTHLYIGKAIRNLSGVFLGVFGVIFIYQLFEENFKYLVLFFAIESILYGLTVFWGGKFLNKFGFRKGLWVSSFFLSAHYLVFYSADLANWRYLVVPAILSLYLYKNIYWLPYHVDFAKFTNQKTRGRQVSLLSATTMLFGIFAPVTAGIIVSRVGFQYLFVLAIVLCIVSAIPYSMVPRTREKFTWSLKETWHQFFSKERRGMVLAYMACGVEGFVGVVVWPIFIYQLLRGNYFQIGLLATLITTFSMILQLSLGRYLDLQKAKRSVLNWGSFFYALGWLIKVFVSTAFHVFVVGIYHDITAIFTGTSFNVIGYDLAADEGHYIDEFTVLREMAINVGKFLTAIIILVASFFIPIRYLFILAALSSLLFNFIRRREEIID